MLPLQIVLEGEWGAAALGLGLVFAVALGGVAGLGWWVLRGDRENRAAAAADSSDSAEAH